MRFKYDWTIPPLYQLFPKMDTWYEVKEVQNDRSLRQNAMLHGYIYPQAIEAFARKGKILNAEHVHFFFKSQFLKKRKKCKVTEKYRYEEWSTSKLSTKQFSVYVEQIRKWVYDTLDYDIQPPHDQEELLYYQNNICE